MGVRFACHACGKRLNIKTELAGKRGICPACSVRFRIPPYDTEVSTPLQSAGIEAEADERLSGSSQGSVSKSRSAKTAAPNSSDSSHCVAADDFGGVAVEESPQDQVKADTEIVPSAPPSADASFHDLLGDQSATWYVRPPNGGQYGPADGPTMGQWIKEGRVADLAMVWRDGWADWRLAKDAILGVVPTQSDPRAARAARADDPSGHSGKPGLQTSPARATENQTAAPAPSASQPAANALPGLELTPRSGPLGSNKQKRSRKRVVASITLGLIFIGLIGALVFVLTRS